MILECIKNDYFDWMYDLVCEGRYANNNSYRRLLSDLHNFNFTCVLKSDRDRANDGVNLRRRFALQYGDNDYDYIIETLEGPCSVLEMMIALAIRCEETIMSDPLLGDRTGQWFWKMVVTLELGGMVDSRYDEFHVNFAVTRFLTRKYEPDGRGGLFIIRNCDYDLRTVTIWTQMMWYLDTIV